MEKMVTLAFIDQAWKEHLREMDDLKQSVQNAVYEQKDPLLIYKFEAFELFKRFLARVNEDTNTFLMHADLPVQDPNQVQEASAPRSRQRLQESKAASESLLSGGRRPDTRNRPPVEKTMPVKSTKVAGRNERVTVQYTDGNIKKGVKFKTVEDDINNNRCVLIED
jgi:preprotein translocase subunit SecA